MMALPLVLSPLIHDELTFKAVEHSFAICTGFPPLSISSVQLDWVYTITNPITLEKGHAFPCSELKQFTMTLSSIHSLCNMVLQALHLS